MKEVYLEYMSFRVLFIYLNHILWNFKLDKVFNRVRNCESTFVTFKIKQREENINTYVCHELISAQQWSQLLLVMLSSFVWVEIATKINNHYK